MVYIPCRVLKEAVAQLCNPFKRLLEEGFLPDGWKQTNVIPIQSSRKVKHLTLGTIILLA